MDKIIRGKAFVVGDNIDTDQIIPAEYLSYNPADAEERKFFGKYALSGVPIAAAGLPEGNIPFVAGSEFTSEFSVVVGGRNFGCGSSREHAPLALAEAGVRAVVAESYARIFYRNAVNGGYVVPFETPGRLVDEVATGDDVTIDTEAHTFTHEPSGRQFELSPLGDAKRIVSAGGIFEYARREGML